MAKKNRRQFSQEFKEEAVKLVTHSGETLKKVAEDLGISVSLLSTWKKQYLKDDPDKEALVAEVKELRKKLRVAEMEREILKKATAFFAKQRA